MRRNNTRIRRNRRRYYASAGSEEVNPMEYLSNLSDVMLILAVGIMLALVLHWNVELHADYSSDEEKARQAVSFSEDDLQGTEEMPDDVQQMGSVYYDPNTGKYYYQIDN